MAVNRSIVVATLPRSGSSCIAGAMHHMGVFMGSDLQGADELNTRGYYEDTKWQAMSKLVCGQRYLLTIPTGVPERFVGTVRGLTAIAMRDHAVWGFKSPRAAVILDKYASIISDMGSDVRIVFVHRNYDDIVASMHRHSQLAYGGEEKMSLPQTRSMMDRWRSGMLAAIERCSVPIFDIQFETLLSSPREELTKLAEFCFEGTDVSPNIDAGVGFVSPDLCNFGGLC